MPSSILVIEDNPTNLELMRYLLDAFGHTVLVAADGEEGLEIARRKMPDLIVCDIQLPIMDGMEVARRLKDHPVLRAIPLIAVTAMAMVGDRDRVLSAGFDGYVAKPIDPRELVGEVDRSLNRSAVRPAPAPEPEAAVQRSTAVPWRGPSDRASILVVDNSRPNLEYAQSALEPLGYDVIMADNVEQALELARRTSPDLILADVHMPGQDGFALIRAARSEPGLASIPFVFLSSSTRSDEDSARGLALGAARFIHRPIEPQALVDEIERCLRARKGA